MCVYWAEYWWCLVLIKNLSCNYNDEESLFLKMGLFEQGDGTLLLVYVKVNRTQFFKSSVISVKRFIESADVCHLMIKD